MTAVPTTLRETGPADLEAIPRVQREAFGRDTEAALTEALLADATTRPALSLLALRGAEAAGHILFTRCRNEEAETAQGSRYPPAPLAVVPCCQRQGIGALSHPAAACRMPDGPRPVEHAPLTHRRQGPLRRHTESSRILE